MEEIHIHFHSDSCKLDHISETLSSINLKINNMAVSQQDALVKAQELAAKVDTLQATIDSEQADIKALTENNAQVVVDLKSQIAALQAIIDENPQVDLQPVMDILSATVTKIEAANTDVASTV